MGKQKPAPIKGQKKEPEPIELFCGTIKCLGVNTGFPAGPNDTINQKNNFYKVKIVLGDPIEILEDEKSVRPQYYTTKTVKEIEEDEDGNVTVRTSAATYRVEIH